MSQVRAVVSHVFQCEGAVHRLIQKESSICGRKKDICLASTVNPVPGRRKQHLFQTQLFIPVVTVINAC